MPTDIPERIEVDVSQLEELESALFVRDMDVPPNVQVLTDPDQLVAKVEAPRLAAELAREEEEAAAAAAEEAKEAAEGEAAPAAEEEAEESQ
jgi:hypothetical protein